MRSIFALVALPLAFAAPVEEKRQQSGAAEKYIVVMHPESNVDSLGIQSSGIYKGINLIHQYDQGDFRGFAAYLDESHISALNKDPKVAYIERDGILHTQQTRDGNDTPSGPNVAAQSNSTWGLSRISHHKRTTTGEYLYDNTAGQGACAYIIDTGIFVDHPEFEGRATFVKNYDKVDGTDKDLFGHGTHVAGTIGSKTYGVSKKVKLFAMKVCNQNGNCELSDVNAAILDTIADSKQRDCPNGVVINMSLGAPNEEWRSIKDSVAQAVKAGVFVSVAAGNEADDAGKYSPASAPGACVAGASNNVDAIAEFSNWGSTVSVFAPGVDILSTYNEGVTSTTIMSGTSMATPHLTGLAAYLLGLNGGISPTDLCQQIQSTSTKNTITGLRTLAGTKNYLAFNGATK